MKYKSGKPQSNRICARKQVTGQVQKVSTRVRSHLLVLMALCTSTSLPWHPAVRHESILEGKPKNQRQSVLQSMKKGPQPPIEQGGRKQVCDRPTQAVPCPAIKQISLCLPNCRISAFRYPIKCRSKENSSSVTLQSFL